MIASVLVHPTISIGFGTAALIILWWYWSALASPDVPVSRRRVRRVTTMLILAAIPLMVMSLSFIDRTTHPREFIIAWTLVFALMLLIMLGAALDAINSVRLHQKELDREAADAAKDLMKAMRDRRESQRKDGQR